MCTKSKYTYYSGITFPRFQAITSTCLLSFSGLDSKTDFERCGDIYYGDFWYRGVISNMYVPLMCAHTDRYLPLMNIGWIWDIPTGRSNDTLKSMKSTKESKNFKLSAEIGVHVFL